MKHFTLFSEQQIYETYLQYVNKPESYYKLYEKLPLELNNKKWKWENKDFPRVWCVLDFQNWLKKYNLGHFKKVLLTCDSDPEIEHITWDECYYAPYQDGRNDLHYFNIEHKDFDFITFHQTLEHLYNPFISMLNLYDHLRTDGYIFTSVPTINIPHAMPFHFNGFTPMGLCLLMKSCGFKIKEIGFWGNRQYINHIFEHNEWPDYKKLMENGIIKNEKDKNVQCWILAQK